ncbi:protein Cep78 homolog, partial [Bombus bifarius]|uniref:Protein Cep78 homolog n=1 Tax=Bombus bifarius TaxID=103933 RepID=A0A6P8MJZ8_9HYME
YPRLAFDDTSRRCKGKDQASPVIYTNFLLRCLVDSIAVCARDSSAITSITLDGIPLSLKYLNILCCGLKNNEKLINLSLTKCHIGDVGCDLLLGCLRNNPKLCVLNLSSCRLSNRSAMCLSLFLKRRKADLLQNVWEQSSVQSPEENSDKKPQGLHTLILNQNPKIGDTGLRQLVYALKSDVWLRSLSLRHCGISKHGAETMIRLLQTNSRITKLDLTENRIPINTLQMILRILKRRREMAESITSKKRFRIDMRRDLINNRIHELIKQRRRSLRNRTERLNKYSTQKRHWKKIHRFEIKVKQSKEIEVPKEDQSRRKKLGDLESQLWSLVESNFKLKEELSSNKALLDTEAQQRSKMEDELQKVSLRLNDLKSKVVMLDCVSSNACKESRLLKGLKYIFDKLESFSTARQKDINEEVLLNPVEPLWSSPLTQQMENSFANCLQQTNVALFPVENITM